MALAAACRRLNSAAARRKCGGIRTSWRRLIYEARSINETMVARLARNSDVT